MAAIVALVWFVFVRDPMPAPEETRAIDVAARAIGPDETGFQPGGAATFAGALDLGSSAPGFQEFSALWVDERGESFVAISDSARVLRGRLQWNGGKLAGIASPTLGALLDPAGGFVAGRDWRDAEAIAREPGGFLIAFEREHRVWRYAPDLEAKPISLPAFPDEIRRTASNGGPEAMTGLFDGRVLVFVERLDGTTPESRRVYLLENGAWRSLDYARRDDMDPVGAETLPNGDLLVIERSSPVDWPRGLRARLRRIDAAAIRAGARLEGPVVASFGRSPATENFEGLAAFRAPDGAATYAVLISDGGGLPRQRTLLVALRLADAR